MKVDAVRWYLEIVPENESDIRFLERHFKMPSPGSTVMETHRCMAIAERYEDRISLTVIPNEK